MPSDAIDLGGSGKAVAYLYVAERERALGFYRDTLGLALLSADPFGDFIALPNALLRMTVMPDVTPHPHPVLGFDVADIEATVTALAARGVAFDIFEGMGQDARGIWTSDDGGMRLAFFKDPDGNGLTLSQS